VREVTNRTLLALMLVLLAFWAAGILGGALKSMITGIGPSPHPCKSCVVKWR
jgi:hypothetical protein